MERKLVSIIVPCYNGEKFVDRCFRSICIQDYSPIELVIIDDGSTDRSKEVIMEWEQPLKNNGIRLSYAYQNNKGLGGAIKTGIENAKGEYITLLDIDDEFLPGCISDRVSYLEKHPEIGCVITNGYIKNGNDKHLFSDRLNKIDRTEIFDKLIIGDLFNWAGSYMVRSNPLKGYYNNHDYFCSRNGQNLQILLPVINKMEVGILDVPHMIYNKQPSSLSNSSTDKMEKSIQNLNDYYDIRMHMIKELITEDKKAGYIRLAQYGLWKSILNVAIEFQNKNLAKEAYSSLIETKMLSLDDRIKYYSLKSKSKYYVLRAMRKLKNTINTVE